MAVKYFVGVPRSGKTYKAMVLLYYIFVKPKYKTYFKFKNYVLNENEKLISFYKILFLKIYVIHKIEFDNAYTNINQFNFSVSDKIFSFDFQDIYEKLVVLHSMHLEKKTDYELIEKAKEYNIYRSLFVIDECHNFFKSKDDPVLIFWLTYHAHFHHELILITQDLSLVNTEYKRVAEYFYRAIPSRYRMFKNIFKYIQYSTAGMYEKDKIGVNTVKAEKRIFSLYVSGADSNGKSVLHKYIFMAVVALVACIISIYSLMTSITPENDNIDITSDEKTQPADTKNKNNQIQQLQQNQTTDILETSENEIITTQPAYTQNQNLKLFKFNCFDKFCYYKIDKKSTIEIPMNILKSFLMNIDEDKKFTEIKNNRLYIYALVDENKFNFINKGVNENEKENNNILPTMSATK